MSWPTKCPVCGAGPSKRVEHFITHDRWNQYIEFFCGGSLRNLNYSGADAFFTESKCSNSHEVAIQLMKKLETLTNAKPVKETSTS